MQRDPRATMCPDCDNTVSRRKFLVGAGSTLALVPLLGSARSHAAPSPTSAAESAVLRLHQSLTPEQRKVVSLAFDDPRRQRISANWSVTPADVDSFSKDQQQIIHEILRGVTSEDGYERFLKQMQADHGGIGHYAVAIFGDPATGPFQFELTGRHLTLRADANSLPGAAFGGPIVYGHGARGNSTGNLFWYQTRRANEVFAALDGAQREKALLPNAPSESAVQFRARGAAIPGIRVSDLSADQQNLVRKVLGDILAPYRKEDVDEVHQVLDATGGVGGLHMAFYKQGDLDDDGVWDIWRVEGPALVCHFRGAPHVHAYINIAHLG